MFFLIYIFFNSHLFTQHMLQLQSLSQKTVTISQTDQNYIKTKNKNDTTVVIIHINTLALDPLLSW